MTDRIGSTLVLREERNQQCDFCGRIAELRPYGPNGECICFKCAMKDEESAKRQFLKRLDGTHPIDQEPRHDR